MQVCYHPCTPTNTRRPAHPADAHRRHMTRSRDTPAVLSTHKSRMHAGPAQLHCTGATMARDSRHLPPVRAQATKTTTRSTMPPCSSTPSTHFIFAFACYRHMAPRASVTCHQLTGQNLRMPWPTDPEILSFFFFSSSQLIDHGSLCSLFLHKTRDTNNTPPPAANHH